MAELCRGSAKNFGSPKFPGVREWEEHLGVRHSDVALLWRRGDFIERRLQSIDWLSGMETVKPRMPYTVSNESDPLLQHSEPQQWNLGSIQGERAHQGTTSVLQVAWGLEPSSADISGEVGYNLD
ncbi:unnamed protein product, partial [Pleuronectes platessa]